ncbi:hypothetical protein ACFW9D_33935 [Streptomyces sp. NPDC059524]|uniref:hypothetical protein n=1 Tax=Streptomyces sp. NPDC059524 TaxID=3346856 RepID=UPI00367A97F2
MTAKLSFDGAWQAEVTGDPLSATPRFTGDSVEVPGYADAKEQQRFLAGTFGSGPVLWDAPDTLRFDPESRKLVGVELQLPYSTAYSEVSDRVPELPEVRPGGLLAAEAEGFRHEMCSVLCRTPGDGVLVCLRGLDVLDAPLDARIGIAPDVALLVQRGAVVGWTVTDPARHLTTPYRAPDPEPPAPATRRMLSECLDLMTEPVVDDLVDGDPAAVARLRAADEALRTQREDPNRAAALRELIAQYVEDYGGGDA